MKVPQHGSSVVLPGIMGHPRMSTLWWVRALLAAGLPDDFGFARLAESDALTAHWLLIMTESLSVLLC